MELKQHNERLEALIKIAQQNPENPNDLLDIALSEALKLTLSEIGFIFRFNNEDNAFSLEAYSRSMIKTSQIKDFEENIHPQISDIILEAITPHKLLIKNKIDSDKSLFNFFTGTDTSVNNILRAPS